MTVAADDIIVERLRGLERSHRRVPRNTLPKLVRRLGGRFGVHDAGTARAITSMFPTIFAAGLPPPSVDVRGARWHTRHRCQTSQDRSNPLGRW
jgi:hypothetical protein